jgi:hypothetical protein
MSWLTTALLGLADVFAAGVAQARVTGLNFGSAITHALTSRWHALSLDPQFGAATVSYQNAGASTNNVALVSDADDDTYFRVQATAIAFDDGVPIYQAELWRDYYVASGTPTAYTALVKAEAPDPDSANLDATFAVVGGVVVAQLKNTTGGTLDWRVRVAIAYFGEVG